MSLLILLWVLAQPGECSDRSPGLSKCVTYLPKTVDRGAVVAWTCRAVCYTPTTWKKDGGTDAKTLESDGATKPLCVTDLEKKCAASQKR